MDVVDKSGLPECAKLIKVGTAIDKRGQLCFTENAELPFKIERVFWISNIPKGESRGCHAHRICAEIVFPAQGSFDMFVSDSEGERTYKMADPSIGIYIGPNVWCELKNFSQDAVCVVLASHRYMTEGYVNDYEEFKRL
ncbi:MAG: FdtA/QdtA family cupin domain-containing protein [Bacteroidaceae bacterium]|nr:FdtA/QdtA family cupin domain-containing protein [Bacteroidaceae bacterium]